MEVPIEGPTPQIQGPQGPIPEDMTLEEFLAEDWGASSLAKSQKEAIAFIQEAGFPILSMPWAIALEFLSYMIDSGSGIDAAAFINQIEMKNAQIGSSIWTKYLEQLEEDSKRQKAYLNSPAYLEKIAHMSPNSVQNLNQAARREESMRTGHISSVKAYRETDGTEAVVFAGFVLAGITIASLSAVDQIGNFPVPASNMLELVPLNLQEAVAVTVNLFLPGLILPNTAKAAMLGFGTGTGEKGAMEAFAKDYGKGTLELLGRNDIDNTIKSMVAHKIADGAEVTKSDLLNATMIAKMMMIAPAVALFYHAQFGAFPTGAEFMDILTGKWDFGPDAPPEARELTKLLRSYIGILPDNLQDASHEELAGFFDSRPSLSQLTDPMAIFASILQQKRQKELPG